MSNIRTINRDDVYKALSSLDWQDLYLPVHFKEIIDDIPDSPKWIPIKFRPMDEEEKQYWEEHYDYDFGDDYDGTMFDCPMPDDGDEVWVCSKCGNVWQDTCQWDDGGLYLESNGDWDDIVAWMPFERPKPWRGEANEVN